MSTCSEMADSRSLDQGTTVDRWHHSVLLLSALGVLMAMHPATPRALSHDSAKLGSPGMLINAQEQASPPELTEFETLMIAGAAALQNGDFNVALEAFDGALVLEPDDPTVLSQVGRALLELGYAGEALPLLSQAAQLAPDLFVTQFNLGTAMLRTGQHQEAINWLRAASQLNPEMPMPRYGLALAYSALGNHTQAIAELEECVSVAPQTTDAWLLLGRLLTEHGNGLEAVLKATESFEKVFEQRPHEGESCLALGRAYRRLDLPEQALRVIGDCERAGIEDPRLYLLKGRILSQMGNFTEARVTLLRAAEGPQAAGPSYLDLAVISRNQGNFDTAIAEYKRTIELRPRVITAYVHLANIYVNRNQPEAAAELLERAIRTVPRSPVAHKELCQVRQGMDDFAGAERYCRRALELNPDLLESYYALALVLRDRGKIDESRQLMEQYRTLTAAEEQEKLESNLAAQVALANIQGLYYFRQDNLERALELFEGAAELARDDWLVAFNLGMTYAALRNHESSVVALGRARELNPRRAQTYPLLAAELRALGSFEEAARIEALGRDLEQRP